jgi:hypothetical protein
VCKIIKKRKEKKRKRKEKRKEGERAIRRKDINLNIHSVNFPIGFLIWRPGK